MIDPKRIVRYDYTDSELEELLIFCVAVAGKPADRMAKAVDEFLNSLRRWEQWEYYSPFELIAGYLNEMCVNDADKLDCLSKTLKEFKITPNKMKAKAIYGLLGHNYDLRNVTAKDLEKVHGIGEKTSRFFVMCHKFNAQHAALDTHILKWLHAEGVDFDLKKKLSYRPTGGTYRALEQEFLSRVPEHLTPAEFDLEIWNIYSTKQQHQKTAGAIHAD